MPRTMPPHRQMIVMITTRTERRRQPHTTFNNI